jgi:outer membrane lipoprotein lolB
MTRKNKLAAFGLTLLLAGCAQTPPADENVTYTATLNPQHWRAEGKIALRYPECHHNRGCEDKGVNANMAWTHHNQDELLVITDPFGQERMRIDYRGGVINVREGTREEVMSKEELAKEVGLPVPLESIANWLITQRSDESFNADGWQVDVRDWQGAYYRSIRLRQKDYQMKLVVQKMTTI